MTSTWFCCLIMFIMHVVYHYELCFLLSVRNLYSKRITPDSFVIVWSVLVSNGSFHFEGITTPGNMPKLNISNSTMNQAPMWMKGAQR
jgi:uncharacterized membrane protein